ncbi:MAG: hypothetical protein IPP67_03695 [Rhodospirillaceae bacterium]|nr:hypothetical protein [Rhodospirillaceae bacterium]
MGFVDTTANIGKGNTFLLSPFIYNPTKLIFMTIKTLAMIMMWRCIMLWSRWIRQSAVAGQSGANAASVVNAVTPVPFGAFLVNNVDGGPLLNMDGVPVTYATLKANKFLQTYTSLTAVLVAAQKAANGGGSAASVRDAVNVEVMNQIIAVQSASNAAIASERVNTIEVPFDFILMVQPIVNQVVVCVQHKIVAMLTLRFLRRFLKLCKQVLVGRT